MDIDAVLSRLLEAPNFFLLVIGTIVVVSVVTGAIRQVLQTFAREKSRREIAAYIAEGAMTPEQGERLMIAGRQ